MYRSKWFFHPVFVFICSTLALGLSLFLYIYWYISVSQGLNTLIQNFNLDRDQVLEPQTWLVVLVLSLLVGLILLGIFIIFVYNQKIIKLYRLQHNFINNFTHELKTPVTSIKLYLETFLKHELPRPDLIKYTGFMLQDIARLSDNINRILNLAKIETKTYSGEFVILDLVTVVERFSRNNSHLFRNARITIQNPSGRAFLFRINVNLFEMLLMNLITNAITYNNSETPKVEITFGQRKRKLLVQFKDNGLGIQKSELHKIFRKFYQVGNSDNLAIRGSGLGLYLAQNVARIHKGRISAQSPGAGLGSVFTLALPFHD
jgi:two-component system, OmpR family, phosphate regulon sensor histidine kinase PhoR